MRSKWMKTRSGSTSIFSNSSNEDELLADVCLTLPLATAASEQCGSGEAILFALLIFLCGKNRLLFHFFNLRVFIQD